MKKALWTLMVVLAAFGAQAQGIRVGLTGGLNSTWLFNSNVSGADDRLDYAATFGGRLGVEAIYSFNEKMGVSLGVNFISKQSQKYEGDAYGGFDYTAKMNYLDVPLLFRLTSTSGTYFEIGPQFGFLSTVEEDFEPTTGIGYEGLDTKDIYNSTNIAAIIGFGVDIDVTEKIFITTGIRLGYGITDITEENAVYTYLRGPSGWAQREDSFGALDYSATNRVFGGLNLGVSYKFGGE